MFIKVLLHHRSSFSVKIFTHWYSLQYLVSPVHSIHFITSSTISTSPWSPHGSSFRQVYFSFVYVSGTCKVRTGFLSFFRLHQPCLARSLHSFLNSSMSSGLSYSGKVGKSLDIENKTHSYPERVSQKTSPYCIRLRKNCPSEVVNTFVLYFEFSIQPLSDILPPTCIPLINPSFTNVVRVVLYYRRIWFHDRYFHSSLH